MLLARGHFVECPIVSGCYFARRRDSWMTTDWGPFQNFWNCLIGHHYIKVILFNRCTPALSCDAGNHKRVRTALEHAARNGEGKRLVAARSLRYCWQTTGPGDFPSRIAQLEGVRGCSRHLRIANQINRQRHAVLPVGSKRGQRGATCGGVKLGQRGKTRLIRRLAQHRECDEVLVPNHDEQSCKDRSSEYRAPQ